MSKVKVASRTGAPTAFSGPRHQLTSAAIAAPHPVAASSGHRTVWFSQRMRVTPWVQARLCVPSSNSLASSGAPQNIPNRSGTAIVAFTRLVTVPSPANNWPA